MNEQKTYVPFEDGLLIGSNKSQEKCIFCGVNMKGNCHTHAPYCQYSCNNQPPIIPIGDNIILLPMLLIYIIIKRLNK